MKENPQPSAPVVVPWEGEPPAMVITTKGEAQLFFHTCWNAQTYEAYSQVLRATVWIPLPCKQWSCRFCAQKKVSHLARRCSAALPNRLLTLTIDPARWDDPRHSFDGTRRQVPELLRLLRRRFGDIEYLRVTELTKRGWPHYHLLVRSGFLPHSVVRDLWAELTGATIVDLRKVDNRFQTYMYLVKYLSKMHNLGWTNRHVSYSRNFFQDDPPEKTDPLELTDGKILEGHPGSLAYHQFRNSELVEIAYNVFTLNPSQEMKDAHSAKAFADPQPQTAKPPPPSYPQRHTAPPPDPQPTLFPKDPTGVSTPRTGSSL